MAKRNPIERPTYTKMLFKSWFIGLLNNDSRVKPHHYESLRIYFKGLGISESETKEVFERGLKTYFGEQMSEGRFHVKWSDKFDCFIAEVPEFTQLIGKGDSPIAAIRDLETKIAEERKTTN